jgi:hypothetical protein
MEAQLSFSALILLTNFLLVLLMIPGSGRLFGIGAVETGIEIEIEIGSAEKSANKDCPGGKTFQSGGVPLDQTTVLTQKKSDESRPVVAVVAVAEESDGVAVGVGSGSCKEGARKVFECERDEGRAFHLKTTQMKG